MKKKVLLKGVLIVLVSSVITRMFGFVFRIFIADKLGAEGMGVFQIVTSLHLFVGLFATSGVSFAVSRMVAENISSKKYSSSILILKFAIFWGILLSLIVMILMFVFPEFIGTNLLRDSRTAKSIIVLAPSIPFIAISSSIKGYFYAVRKPIHPSMACVIEQTVKLAVVVLVMTFFNIENCSNACAAVSFSMTVSEIASCIFVWVVYLISEKLIEKENFGRKNILINIIKISVPIQISDSTGAILRLAEGVLVVNCLKVFAAGNSAVATGTLGIVKGMVFPLIMFPTSLIQALITLLVPEISGANAVGNKRAISKACEKSMQVTLCLSLFVTAIFFVFPNQIGGFFYKKESVGPLIRILSLICPLTYAQIINVGILNSIGEQVSSMRYNVIDGVLRLALIFIAVPKFGVNAYLIVIFFSNIFLFLSNQIRLLRITHSPICLSKIYFKPVIAVVCSSYIVFTIMKFFNFENIEMFGVFVYSGLIGVIYLILLVLFKCFKLPSFNEIFNLIFSYKVKKEKDALK